MTRGLICVVLGVSLLTCGCAGVSSSQENELSVAVSLAEAGVSLYAADPKSNPRIVSTLQGLLAAAQAAVKSAQSSGSSGDVAAAEAAIAAVVAFQTQMQAGAAEKSPGH